MLPPEFPKRPRGCAPARTVSRGSRCRTRCKLEPQLRRALRRRRAAPLPARLRAPYRAARQGARDRTTTPSSCNTASGSSRSTAAGTCRCATSWPCWAASTRAAATVLTPDENEVADALFERWTRPAQASRPSARRPQGQFGHSLLLEGRRHRRRQVDLTRSDDHQMGQGRPAGHERRAVLLRHAADRAQPARDACQRPGRPDRWPSNPELRRVGIAEAFSYAADNKTRYADFFEADGSITRRRLLRRGRVGPAGAPALTCRGVVVELTLRSLGAMIYIRHD